MKCLVCGGRNFFDKEFVFNNLDQLHKEYKFSLIIHGMARGADTLANDWALERGIPVQGFKANWFIYGKAAGIIRNQEMLDKGDPDIVVAFPGGKGTRDMVNRASGRLGIQIFEFTK